MNVQASATLTGGATTSNTLAITVGTGTATDTLTASPNPTTTGTAVTYTATLTGPSVTPTGSVTFKDGGTPISGCGTSGVVPLVSGVATCTVTYSSTTGSPHSITAPFVGDTYYDSAAGNTVSEVVNAPALSLNSVFASNATNVWAVGTGCQILYSQGTTAPATWTAEKTPGGCTTTLNGVTTDTAGSDDVFAVGAGGTIMVCTTSCQTPASANWAELAGTKATTNTLYGVVQTMNGSAKGLYAVGQGGVILYCNTSCAANYSDWTPITFAGQSTQTLYAVGWDGSGSSAYAVGAAGTVEVSTNGSNAGTWTASTVGTADLHGIFGSGSNKIMAVGAGGKILVCSSNCGQSPTNFAAYTGTAPTTNDLDALTATGQNTWWAVGAGGTIVYCSANCLATTGATWATEPSPTTQPLFGVTSVGTPAEWAVGGNDVEVYNTAANTGQNWHGPASKLVFTTQPASGATAGDAGTTISPQPVVTAEDSNGNTDTTYTGNVTLTGSGAGTFTCPTSTTTVAAVAGVATFAGCQFSATGSSVTMTASSGTLTNATSNTFVIAAAPVFSGITFAGTSGAGMAPNCTSTAGMGPGGLNWTPGTPSNDVNTFPNAICSADGYAGNPSTFTWHVELASGTPGSGTPVTNTGAPLTVTVTTVTPHGTNGGNAPTGPAVGSTQTFANGSSATTCAFVIGNIGGGDWIQVTVSVTIGSTTYTLEMQVH